MVYRAFIAFILSKWYRGYHGYMGMVDPGFSTAYAIEYLSSLHNSQPSRNTILTRQVLEGHVPFKICKEKLENGWIKAKNNNQHWKFPELREYIDSWMGHCYWREESQFDFNSHVHYHKTEEFKDVDHYTSNLFEQLMNTPFLPQKSPWDVHIIHGWKQDCSPSENNNSLVTIKNPEITVVVTRTHHVLGDGKSVLHLIFQDLFGVCMNDHQNQGGVKVIKKTVSIPQKLVTVIKIITKLMWDFGCIALFVLWRANTNTKFHSRQNRELNYVHHMSDLVCMDTVKNIRTKFGVSFSGVVFSGLSSAIAQNLDKDHSGNFLMAAPRPLPGHPTGRMVNHM